MPHAAANAAPSAPARIRRLPRRLGALLSAAPRRAALGAFAVGLAVSVLLAARIGESELQAAQLRFDRDAASIEHQVGARLVRPADGLRGLRALFASGGTPDETQFAAAVASLDLAREFPGVLGFGFIERPAEGNALERFTLRRAAPPAWAREARQHPLADDAAAREALQQALDSGALTVSGRIALPSGAQSTPGLMLVLPLYRPGGKAPPTAAGRAADLLGMLYAPIDTRVLIRDIAQTSDGHLDFELFDGDGTHTDGLLFDADGHLGTARREIGERDFSSRQFSSVRPLSVGGRALTLRVSSTPDLEAGLHRGRPWATFAIGALGSALLAWTIWLLGVGRERAQRLAAKMTEHLRAAHRETQDALRRSEALLRTLHEHALVSITDPAGTIVEVNGPFCRASGYAREELIGRNHRILGAERHSPFFWLEMWTALGSGRSWRGEICNRTKDGRLFWLDTVIMPVLDDTGRVEQYIAIRHDITASKLAQQALREKDERFELALEGGNDGLWDWFDVHSQAEWWSPQFYRLLGYEPGEIEASRVEFDDRLHPDDRERTFAALAEALTQEAVHEALLGDRGHFDTEIRLRTKSGAYRWFHARAKVFFDEWGEPTRMAGSIQDIHDRWVAQREIQARSEQLDAIFALSPDAFVSFDAQGLVSYASPATARLTGVPPEAWRGLDEAAFVQRLTADAAPATRLGSLAPLRDAPAQAPRTLIELLRPARRTLQVSVHTSELNQSLSQVVHLRDVTHETEVEQMKSEFLSTAAHELRTPMASIYGFTELLMTRDYAPERARQMLAKIHRQSEAMIAILNELLDLARIEARRASDFMLQPLDLGALAADAIRDFQPPGGREPPTLTLDGDAHPLSADRAKLMQVIRNLLSNAFKYSPGGGPVAVTVTRVATDPRGPGCRLAVRDHGIGMSPEQLARVCERFYRADTSGAIAGTGLGMSIVKEIVELHGGSLVLESALGEGTTASVWLPMAEPAGSAAEATAAKAAVSGASPTLIEA